MVRSAFCTAHTKTLGNILRYTSSWTVRRRHAHSLSAQPGFKSYLRMGSAVRESVLFSV